MLFRDFIGPSYQSQSLNEDAEDCTNWYAEKSQSAGAKSPYAYYRRPGLATFSTPTSGVGRGIWPGENRLFAVVGSHFYEILQNGSTVDQGSVGNDGNPADLAFNGSQVLIASNGWAWADTGSSVSPAHFTNPWTDLVINGANPAIISSVLLPFTAGDVGAGIDVTSGTGFTVGFYTVLSVDGLGNATMSSAVGTIGSTGGHAAQRVPAVRVAYLDGYFWAQAGFNSKLIYLSNLLDATTWQAANFASKEGYPDNIAAIFPDHEEMYLFGDEESTEVWRNNDQVFPQFPFERDPGAFMHHGNRAPFAVARLANGIGWLAGDQKRGGVYAVYAQGYNPERISTHAVESAWNSYAKTSDAVAYGEILNGHSFFVVSFPTANVTWAYDTTTGFWSKRGWWNGSSNDRARVAFQCYVGLGTLAPTYYGLDWQTGQIYTVAIQNLTDAGTSIVRVRTAPYFANEAEYVYTDRFQLDMQASGTVPVTLEYSDDGALTWSPKHLTAWNPQAARRYGVVWRRLGKSRARIYRVTVSAAADMALINAYIGDPPVVNPG